MGRMEGRNDAKICFAGETTGGIKGATTSFLPIIINLESQSTRIESTNARTIPTIQET